MASQTTLPAETISTEVSHSSDTDALDLHPSLEGRDYFAAVRDVVDREDPAVDGWDSEQFNDLAMLQLKDVGSLLSHSELIDAPHVLTICSDQYIAGVLRPRSLTITVDDPPFTVRRGVSRTDDASTQRGHSAFISDLHDQLIPLQDARDIRYKFKIVRVTLQDKSAKTTVYFQLSGQIPRGRVQVNSTWLCEWEAVSQTDRPRLKAIQVQDYEELVVSTPSLPLFSDCTQAAFNDLSALSNQLIHGRDYWYGNLEATIGVEGRGNGIAIGDANGDGLDDIYLCQPAALPNRLFIRQPDGSLRDESQSAGVDWLDSTRAALWIDVDNDGDDDLVLTQSTRVLLHENDGAGHFTLRTTIATNSRLFSLNAIDYDGDRDLDLFVCGYSASGQTRPEDIFVSPVPYHDANNGAPNLMLRNDGDWSFTNVTETIGLDANNLRFSLASAWDDFDNDGDLDLYVANDFGRNNLYRNDDGHFVDVASAAGVEDIGPGMSAAWGDYNNDGRMDLYVSNMFSSAGSRITHNAQFKPGAARDDLVGFQRHARGNSLLENRGDGRFSDQSVRMGVTMGRWAWGSLFVDLNNDGWRDLYVTNGFVTADDNNDL